MSKTVISKRTDWEQMENEVAAIIKRLRSKPNKRGFQASPGGILNAYREGDITFEGAIEHLNDWNLRHIKDQIEELKKAAGLLKKHRVKSPNEIL